MSWARMKPMEKLLVLHAPIDYLTGRFLEELERGHTESARSTAMAIVKRIYLAEKDKAYPEEYKIFK